MIVEFIIILVILIMLSGLFSGLETAYTSLTHIQIKKLKEKKRKNILIVESLKDRTHKLITTILICNNLINIGASALATYFTMQLFGSKAIGITTGILTLLILVFGEVVPKKLAIDYNDTVCLHSAFFLDMLMTILTPVIWIIDTLGGILLNLFGKNESKPKITEEDIISAVEIGEEIGELEPQEKTMIHNIFKFNDIEVGDIITHRTDVFSLDEKTRINDVIDLIVKNGYSRVPVYKESKENIVGMLFLKKIIPYLTNKKANPEIRKVMDKPFFVPETIMIDDLFKEFKKKKIHIAVVVDERGGVTGIVTIEDVLEEIVGEIFDETDVVQKKFNRLNKNTYLIDGSLEIKKVNKFLKLKLSQKERHESISGYLFRKIGEVPIKGQEIRLRKGKFIVDKIQNNRIDLVKYVKK